MTELIRALVEVKTPLSLFAFVSLIFLLAFRTKQVPELFFDLAKDKLTKERFAQLLHRFMLFAFIGFVLLCIMAVAGQLLAVRMQPQPISLDDLRRELNKASGSEDEKKAALKQYADSLAYIQGHDIAHAIESLQKSIEAVPTLAAQATLSYLYQKSGDAPNARKYAIAAQSIAIQRGDSMAQLRTERLIAGDNGVARPKPLVGAKDPLPTGGKSFEDAVSISPGVFITTHGLAPGVLEYFKVSVDANRTLRVDFRTPDDKVGAGASIYDENGILKGYKGESHPSALGSVQWSPTVSGILFLSVGVREVYSNSAGTVYEVLIE